ncbi:hypothetical protein ACOSQ4_012604 [Xanthoceras sorbifolium]
MCVCHFPKPFLSFSFFYNIKSKKIIKKSGKRFFHVLLRNTNKVPAFFSLRFELFGFFVLFPVWLLYKLQKPDKLLLLTFFFSSLWYTKKLASPSKITKPHLLSEQYFLSSF